MDETSLIRSNVPQSNANLVGIRNNEPFKKLDHSDIDVQISEDTE